MSEAENIAQTIRKAIQDFLAPEVRELKVRMESVQDRISGLESRMNARFEAADARSDAQFKALLAAIAQSKAKTSSPLFALWQP